MSLGGGGPHQVMKTEAVSLVQATHLQVKDEDATDSTNIVTQVFAEKYSVTLTPTAWMIANGKKGTIIVEYIIKTDPGAGTVVVQTLVNAADAKEVAALNIAAGEQVVAHTDIAAATLALGTPMVVSLEAKNSDAGQTSVIDYFNAYFMIRTASESTVEVARLTDIQSLSVVVNRAIYKVWSGAVNTAYFYIRAENAAGLIVDASTSVTKEKEAWLVYL